MRALAAAQAADGCVSEQVVAEQARLAGVSARQVRRWWSQDPANLRRIHVVPEPCERPADPKRFRQSATGRTRFVITQEHLEVLAGHGQIKKAWKQLSEQDPLVPSYPAFAAALSAQIGAGVRAALIGSGAKELAARRLYLSPASARRNSVWQMDSQEIPVRMIAERGRVVKPWQTTIIDVATRTIMGTVITDHRPNSSDAVACLLKAMRTRQVLLPDGEVVTLGGAPEQLVVDNAQEFLSEAVALLAGRCGITVWPATAHSPWEKGHIESWHRTIQQDLFLGMVGATHGPLTHSRKPLWDPEPARSQSAGQLTALELGIEQTMTWIEAYNFERPHTSLGSSPMHAWAADAAPLRLVSDEILVEFWPVAPKARRLDKAGIRFEGINWGAPELDSLIGCGRTAQVRYLPHAQFDDARIAVYIDGAFVCFATPTSTWDEEQRRVLLLQRREQYALLKRSQVAGTKRRAERADEALKTGGLPAALPASAQAGGGEQAMAKLLNLFGDDVAAAAPAFDGAALIAAEEAGAQGDAASGDAP